MTGFKRRPEPRPTPRIVREPVTPRFTVPSAPMTPKLATSAFLLACLLHPDFGRCRGQS